MCIFTCLYSCDKSDKLEGTTWESDVFDTKLFGEAPETYSFKIQIETSFRVAQRGIHKVRIFEIYESFLDSTIIMDDGFYIYASSSYTCEGNNLTLNYEDGEIFTKMTKK